MPRTPINIARIGSFRLQLIGYCLFALTCGTSIQGNIPNSGHEVVPLENIVAYLDDNGERVPIEGIEIDDDQIALFYHNPSGTKELVRDNSRLVFSLSDPEVIDYLYEPNQKIIVKREYLPNDNAPPKTFVYAYIEAEEAKETWPADGDEVVALLISTRDGEIILPQAIVDIREIAESAVSKSISLSDASHQQRLQRTPYLTAITRSGVLRLSKKARIKTQLSPLPDTWDNPSDQISILVRATRNSRIDVLNRLLKTVNLRKRELKTLKTYLLYVAAFHGRTDAAFHLKNEGADLFADTPKSFLKKYNLRSENPYRNVRDALTTAIAEGNAETFETIFERPKNSSEERAMESLLGSCFIYRQYGIAEFLADNGIKPTSSIFQGDLEYLLVNTILAGAHQVAEEILLPLIGDFRDDSLFINEVASAISPSTLDELHKKGAPIDLPDRDGNTPLLLAAGYGNIPTVCWLLDKGAKLDSVNRAGHSALQYSIVKRQNESASCLIGQGSDVNIYGPEGITPLMFAALFESPNISESIIDRGGIINLDSRALDQTLIAIADQDLDLVLAQAMAQGLSEQALIHGKWPLNWIFEYYGAEKCLTLCKSRSPLKSLPIASDRYSLSIQNLNTSEFKKHRDIPNDLKEINVRCLIDSDGSPFLVQIRNDIDPISKNNIELLIKSFQLSRNLIPSDSRLILAEFEIPTESKEFEFPFDIRTKELLAIEFPTD